MTNKMIYKQQSNGASMQIWGKNEVGSLKFQCRTQAREEQTPQVEW